MLVLRQAGQGGLTGAVRAEAKDHVDSTPASLNRLLGLVEKLAKLHALTHLIKARKAKYQTDQARIRSQLLSH